MLGLTTKKPDEEGLSPTKKVSEEEASHEYSPDELGQ